MGEGPDEGPDEADLERFGGVTQTCPECKAELYDDAEVCWKCGHAMQARTHTPPTWVMIVIAAVITFVVLGMVFR